MTLEIDIRAKNYEINVLDQDDYAAIVFSTSCAKPSLNLDELNKDLTRLDIKNKKIIFDMMIDMGNTAERFTEAVFNGEHLVPATFAFAKIDKKSPLRQCSADFFMKNPSMLEYSVLTSVQQKLINKGIAI